VVVVMVMVFLWSSRRLWEGGVVVGAGVVDRGGGRDRRLVTRSGCRLVCGI